MTLNEQQSALWNGKKGAAWVQSQALLDELFCELADVVIAGIPSGQSLKVLDVGCGTGAVSLTLANHLAADGHVTGLDISMPMLARAKERAAAAGLTDQTTFILADAQIHGFEPGEFDHIISRFGVMFFADTAMAFRNLRKAVKPGASLSVAAWRAPQENPFMITADQAVRSLMPDLPPRDTSGPGQFAFADDMLVAGYMADAGWADVTITAIDPNCVMPRASLSDFVIRMGPLGEILDAAPPDQQAQIIDTVLGGFDRFMDGDHVRFTAACWLIEATNPE
ncbi:MAG: class I SAM-dependent methyltransferase [Pseudomonadota bacterium]